MRPLWGRCTIRNPERHPPSELGCHYPAPSRVPNPVLENRLLVGPVPPPQFGLSLTKLCCPSSQVAYLLLLLITLQTAKCESINTPSSTSPRSKRKPREKGPKLLKPSSRCNHPRSPASPSRLIPRLRLKSASRRSSGRTHCQPSVNSTPPLSSPLQSSSRKRLSSP